MHVITDSIDIVEWVGAILLNRMVLAMRLEERELVDNLHTDFLAFRDKLLVYLDRLVAGAPDLIPFFKLQIFWGRVSVFVGISVIRELALHSWVIGLSLFYCAELLLLALDSIHWTALRVKLIWLLIYVLWPVGWCVGRILDGRILV